MHQLTDTESQALAVAAKIIKCDPLHLAAVIEFESAWNPLAQNKISGARGLIQFLNGTSQTLGYKNADQLVLLHHTAESQLLGPVVRFFRNVGASFPTLVSVGMGVFYPVYRLEAETKVFPEEVQRQNPGIKTVGDYMDKVRARMA